MQLPSPGKGYGKIALALIQKHCFTILHAHRLWLDVRAHNSRAQKVYESMGFVQEGRLRDSVFYDGHYEDLIVLSILEDEYRRGADFADTIH